MRNIFTVTFLLIFPGIPAKNKKPDAESLFMEATASLLNMDFIKAKKHFIKAWKVYDHLKDEKKMNECLIGLATAEFMSGNYKSALRLFIKCRKQLLSRDPGDREGLELLESNISLCQALMSPLSKLQSLK